ncbi:MAG: hypothetical protein HY767_00360 [Candidatus Omnitrophica bacterium]|nr:hypothetical protein [Candidatus Omnitrophota bacterium]
METRANFCSSCGEQNNPAFENCHKCGSKINIQQERTRNGVSVFSSKEFFSATRERYPSQWSMTHWEGLPFQCVCGKPHNFSQGKVRVIGDLPKARLIFACPEGSGMVCVHPKGIFQITGFESLFGTLTTENIIDISAVVTSEKDSDSGTDSDSEGMLIKKSAVVAQILCASLNNVSSQIEYVAKGVQREELKKVLEEHNDVITMNICFLFLHVTRRLSLEILGLKKSEIFSRNLFAETSSQFLENSSREAKVSFLDTLREEEKKYAKCEQLFANEGEPLRGTLFCEFTDRLSSLLLGSQDPIFFMHIYALVLSSFSLFLKAAKLGELLEGQK